MSPFWIGARRGLWQANIIGLPWVIAIAVYRESYWIAGYGAALLVVVIYTWPWAGSRFSDNRRNMKTTDGVNRKG